MLRIAMPVAMEVAATAAMLVVPMAFGTARWPLLARAARRDHLPRRRACGFGSGRRRLGRSSLGRSIGRTSAEAATPSAAAPAPAAVVALLRTSLSCGGVRGGSRRGRRQLSCSRLDHGRGGRRSACGARGLDGGSRGGRRLARGFGLVHGPYNDAQNGPREQAR